ncbi:MAG TPA: hypothetical protein VI462_01635, partial [Acidimicrobiia bacterium]
MPCDATPGRHPPWGAVRAGRRVIGRRGGRVVLGLLVAAPLLGACATVTTAGGCGISPGSVCPGTYMKG